MSGGRDAAAAEKRLSPHQSASLTASPQGEAIGREKTGERRRAGGKKRAADESWRELAGKLPTRLGSEITESVFKGVYDQEALGESYILYKRERMVIEPPLKQTMTAEDWAEFDKNTRVTWGAACRCTRCGEDFMTAWVKGGGIYLTQGDDGLTYTDEEGTGMMFLDGETLQCPLCQGGAELQPFREVRSGRTWQVLQPEIISADGYDGVLFWLVRRHTAPDGVDGVVIEPRDALMVDRAGKLRRYTYENNAWRPCERVRDPEQITYYSHDAANGRAVGGWGFDVWPEALTGTGEKTALEIYAAHAGGWPGRYLQLWQKHPNVENLMRQGFA